MKLEELKRYILILREEEMDNNYKLSEEQVKLVTKVRTAMIEDLSIKEKLDKMLMSQSTEEINFINEGKVYEKPVVDFEEEKGRQLTYKKAGFVDALVMALVTGFVSGIATTILFMLIR